MNDITRDDRLAKKILEQVYGLYFPELKALTKAVMHETMRIRCNSQGHDWEPWVEKDDVGHKRHRICKWCPKIEVRPS